MRNLIRHIALSLRGKLLLFAFVLVIVPGVVFGLLTITSTRRALEGAVGRQLAEVAEDTASEVSERLLREQATMHTWAKQEVMRELFIGDIDKHISRFLASLRASDSGFLRLICVDVNGRVIASSDPALIGRDESGQAWWQGVAGGEDFLAGPFRAGELDAPVFAIAVPVVDPEHGSERRGGMLGLLNWDRFTAVSNRIQRNSQRHKFRVDIDLLDNAGNVIAEAAVVHGPSLVGKNLRQEGWRSAQVLPVTDPGFLRDRGADALVGLARVPELRFQWTVIVRQPLEEAFAEAYRLQRRLSILLTGVLLVAMGVALLFAERLGRPLRQLKAATRAIAETGAAPDPIEVRSRDEIGALAIAFNRMSRQLQRAQSDLVTAAKFAFVGEVAAGVAHEVRTPLGILRSSAQLLRRSAPSDSEAIELVDMIVGEVDRLDRVVAQLLELARPREPIVEPTALGPLLGRAMEFIHARAAEAGIKVEGNLKSSIRRARCDPEQIYQVTLNLLVNALQAMPHGGRLSVKTAAGANGYVGFTVSDTGSGMTPDVMEKIFTPFFTRRQGGTGLGLAFVQRTIQAHHGQVHVHSEVGHGTTFKIDLPAVEE
ncbi:MAG: HAMP domain-containing protein [Deltaproteobacteria bacterium]|nr:HAMP domain-containing protein [Deltaproteobacteria bacterium]